MRQPLVARIDGLEKRDFEPHAFVSAKKYILTTTHMSTEASMDSIVILFAVEVLCQPFCLKLQFLYIFFNNILQLVGINV